MGYKGWYVDSEIIAPGSAEQDFEARYYFRSMCLHKEAFTAIIQTIAESHTRNIDPFLLSTLLELRQSLYPALAEQIMTLGTFKDNEQHVW